MNPETDAAEQVVSSATRIVIQGFEAVGNLAIKGSVSLGSFLAAYLSQQKKTKGRTRISNFDGKPTKVFVINRKDLELFAREAKRYGVLYAAVLDKQNNDGLVDIIVNDADAAKVNRIADRFALSMEDVRRVQEELLKEYGDQFSKDENDGQDGVAKDGNTFDLNDEDISNAFGDIENPTQAETEKGANPSEHTSNYNEPTNDLTDIERQVVVDAMDFDDRTNPVVQVDDKKHRHDISDYGDKKSVKKEIADKRQERKEHVKANSKVRTHNMEQGR